MKKLLIWCLILGVIAYGTFKSVAWYQVNRLILQVKKAAELHVAIRHGWISTSLWGEVTIHDVEVTPFQLRKPLLAEEVVIRFGSIFEMLSLVSMNSESDRINLPSSMEFEVQQVNLPLTNHWSVYLPDAKIQRDLFGLACGDIEEIGAEEFAAMGYGAIPLDLKVGYQYEPETSQLRLSFEGLLEGMGLHMGSVELQYNYPLQWPLQATGKLPKLNKLNYSIEDQSFMRRVTLLCGKNAGYNQQEFIQASLDKTQKNLARAGITISQALYNAYATFLKGDGVIEIIVSPQGLDLTSLAAMSPEEISQALNYLIKVNRVRIPRGEFFVNAKQLTDYLFPPPVEDKPKSRRPAFVERVAAYQPVALEFADQLIGSKVRLSQRSGKVTEGILQAANRFRMSVGVQVEQGSVLFHFDNADIKDFQVWSKDNLSLLAPVSKQEIRDQEQLTELVEKLDGTNTEIVFEEGVDPDKPLEEGEYYEIIEIEDERPLVAPTLNDLPLDSAQPPAANQNANGQ